MILYCSDCKQMIEDNRADGDFHCRHNNTRPATHQEYIKWVLAGNKSKKLKLIDTGE